MFPDPDQPFLRGGSSSEATKDNLEPLLITRFSTHVIVPCLVTVPDLNVTLQAVCALFYQVKLSSSESLVCLQFCNGCTSSQYPIPLEKSKMTWDNKRGWSIPRQVIDSSPMLIWFSCLATLGGRQYQSVSYLIHVTGKTHQNVTSVWTPKGILGKLKVTEAKFSSYCTNT